MRSLGFLLAQRMWQALSGVITLALVATVFTTEQQGWYYSFLSVAALYTLFDLGLSTVLVQVTAHYFTGAAWSGKGSVTGNSDSVKSLTSWSWRHYLALSILFCALLVPGGWLFFSHEAQQTLAVVNWQMTWLFLVIATALSMLGIPFLSIIEGSGEVSQAYAIRLAQGIAGAAGCWITLLSGGGLWAIAVAPGVSTLLLWYWLATRWPSLLSEAWRSQKSYFDFKQEVWSLQWRVGISWLSSYTLTQIYIPILLHFRGGVEAGQMGLSLTLMNMLVLIAQSWVTRHIPAMGMAAKRRDWLSLDRIFSRDFRSSCLIFFLGVVCIGLVRTWLNGHPLEERVLPITPLLGLFALGFINHTIGMLAVQLRSFRQEPLVWVSLLGAALSMPCAIFGAKYMGADGVIMAVGCVQLAISLPLSLWLWKRSNRIFREPS